MTQWITLLANVVLVFALALFVSNLLQGQTQGKLLWILPVTLIAVMLVRGIANTVNQKLSFQASSNVKRRLRELTYEKLMRLGTKYHENIATSALTSWRSILENMCRSFFTVYWHHSRYL